MFRRWPLNNFAKTVGPHNNGILYGINKTPPSFGSTNNTVEAIPEFRRLNPIKPDSKWTAIISSSDVVASKKRATIGKSTYYSPDNEIFTKRTNTVDYVMGKIRS